MARLVVTVRPPEVTVPRALQADTPHRPAHRLLARLTAALRWLRLAEDR